MLEACLDLDSDDLDARLDPTGWAAGHRAREQHGGKRESSSRGIRDCGTDSDARHLSLKFCSPEVPFVLTVRSLDFEYLH